MSTLSFEEFKKRKQSSRSSFISKNGKKRKATNEEVKIQVGILHGVDGILRKIKGRTLPVTTNVTVDASEILQIAIDKHAKHFRQFNTACKYVLLYPDYTIVNTLPGSLKGFTLEAYKEDLGRTYAKIYLWLCKQEDYETLRDVESDPEGTNLKPAFAEQNSDDNTCQTLPATTHDPVATSSTATSSSVVAAHHTIIPYLSSNSNSTLCQSREEVSALCPICYQSFPVEVIASHADLCAQAFDPIGEIIEEIDVLSDPENNIDTATDLPTDETTSQSQPINSLAFQPIVAQLQMKINFSNKMRINVRRKHIFQDFLAIRKKPWFDLGKVFKVTFIGEPAIDDGGPRREFFSGLLRLTIISCMT